MNAHNENNMTDNTGVGTTPVWFESDLFPSVKDKLVLSEKEWRERLTETEYQILRAEATERPYDNEYCDTETEGVYLCRSCSNPIFSSAEKYHSGTGWPSFYAPISPDRIGFKSDKQLLMERTEVHCARCNSHLGHVFDDGPAPTGLRYCLNSSTLRLINETSHKKIKEGREDDLDFVLNR